MIKKLFKKCRFLGMSALLGVLLLTSCGTPKNVVYFSDLDSVKFKQLSKAEFKEPIIQNDDILSITVQTIDQIVSSSVNQTTNGPGLEPVGIAVNSFLVDKSGNVEIPLLGTVKLAGLTTTEAKDLIKIKAAKYYKEPTVQIRFANYKITVIGEVLKPSSYILPNEKVTVLDAISLAGDLTIFGKRDNVMLIRDNGDKKEVIRLDLTSSTMLSSPYFYLKQNDVIYVEPSEARIAANNSERNRLIALGLSLAAFAITIFRIL